MYRFAGRVSEAAEAMLASDWEHSPGPAAQKGNKGAAQGRGWAGRTGPMATLVKLHVELSSSPSASIAELAPCLEASPVGSEKFSGVRAVLLHSDTIPRKARSDLTSAMLKGGGRSLLQHSDLLMPGILIIKKPAELLALLEAACSGTQERCLPAVLTSSTLLVWYKALLEVLLHQMELLSLRLQKADPVEEEETCALLSEACLHAKAFSGLMQVTKGHQKSKQVLLGPLYPF